MSKFLLALLALLMFTVIHSAAQSGSGEINGIIKDIQQDPIGGAEIHLISATDSSVVQRKVSKDNGRFNFSGLKPNRYLIKINAKGNRPYAGTVIELSVNQMNVVLPPIILSPANQKQLKEVVVNSKKPLIETEIDKTVVNVDAMISASTSNVLEILEKTPGVAVSADGEITLNSKAGVLVLIEGRQTYMSMADLAAYLRSIPGASIEKIELMTNPPARFDAAGGAVINIKFKKNKQAGFTGNFSASFAQGISNRWSNTLNLTYNTKKYSLFGNISYNDGKDFSDDRYYRTYFDSSHSITSKATLLNYRTDWSRDVNGRVGIDYSLTKKTSVGMQVAGYYRKRDEQMVYSNYFDETPDYSKPNAYGTTQSRLPWSQINVNANFLHKFNNNGRELSAEGNYIKYNNDIQQLMDNNLNPFNGNGDSNYLFRYIVPADIDIYTAKIDYEHPLKNKAHFSMGAKTSWVENKTFSDYYDVEQGNNLHDPAKSNHFIYNENINAVYINGRKEWKRFGTQIGLRMENTQTDGHQLGNAVIPENRVKRSYTDFFPSVFFSYKLDSAAKHKVTVSLARRISRPYYQQLNPFLIFVDQYNYRTGNPYLKPAYNSVVNFNYTYKQWFRFNIEYDRYDDAIFSATASVDSLFITRPENAAMRRMLAMIIGFQLPVQKWWRSNLNLAVANFKTEGELYGINLSQNINAFRIQSFNMFTFKKDWSAESFFQYTHRLINLQRVMEPRWMLNLAVQKKILKGKGFLKLTVNDVFWSSKYKETITTNGAEAVHYDIRDSRRVGLSFNFNFGKDTFKRNRRNVEAGDDVKGRVE